MIFLSSERVEELAVDMEKRREEYRDDGESFERSMKIVVESIPELRYASATQISEVRSTVAGKMNERLLSKGSETGPPARIPEAKVEKEPWVERVHDR